MEKQNLIKFRLGSNYDNNGSKETVPVIRIKGKVNVSLNYINNEAVSTEVGTKATLDQLATTDRVLLSKYVIKDSTENLISFEFITNQDGDIFLDFSKLLTNQTFLKFYQKYKGVVTLSITIETPKTDVYNVFVDNYKIYPEWVIENDVIIFKSYDYFENDEIIIIPLISEKVTDFATLRQTYKSVEETYNLIKKQYESQISGDVDLEIDTAEDYEPKTFKSVITRLLELQEGTLNSAIEYSKTAKLITEYERLSNINKLINNLCKMYPDITIEDGEGIPYNSDKALNTKTL